MTRTKAKELEEKYRIIRKIKKGGFGIVYYGVHRKLNKPVAIKEISPTLLNEPKYLGMFQEEALNVAKLSHPNIVHIYDFLKTEDGHFFIIMEYIDGIDLAKILRHARKQASRIPSQLAVYIASEICKAVHYAHERHDPITNRNLNLVHQDISPSNIMISRLGEVKLIDFGIASVRRHQRQQEKGSKVRGKLPYMAPEQLFSRSEPDHRSDIFSIALVLFEILTCDRIFNTQEEFISVRKNQKSLRKKLIKHELAPDLEKILCRALEFDLSKRYQQAHDMNKELLQSLSSYGHFNDLNEELAELVKSKTAIVY